jgi:hypothetical protein
MKTKKIGIAVAGVIILALAVTAVFTMPRFYRGDRIKLNIRVEGVQADALEFTVDDRIPGEDAFEVKTNGDTAEVSIKADQYDTYSVRIDGADKPLEVRVKKWDWHELVDVDIDFTVAGNAVSYSAESSATKGELPFRERSSTSGVAEEKDGYYSVYIA